MVARATLLVVALLACAWYVLGIRQSKDVTHANAIVQSSARLTPAQAARARSLLDGAATLNPDQQVDVLRARVALGLGDHAGAERILRAVTRREPKNVEGWLWITRASTNRNTFFAGLARIAQLEPKVK